MGGVVVVLFFCLDVFFCLGLKGDLKRACFWGELLFVLFERFGLGILKGLVFGGSCCLFCLNVLVWGS